MTATEQRKQLGISAEHEGEQIKIQLGGATVWLTVTQAKRFVYELAGAYLRADGTIK